LLDALMMGEFNQVWMSIALTNRFCKMLWCSVGMGFWLIAWSNNSQAGDSSKFGDRWNSVREVVGRDWACTMLIV
jgi:hypothetical protein